MNTIFILNLILRGRAPTRRAKRGRDRGKGGRNLARRTLLEAKWKALYRDRNIPDFSATLGIKVYR